MLKSLVDTFWSEHVWLPPNVTWDDIAPGPDKAVNYNDHTHVWYPIPLALGFIALRCVVERGILAPFGRYLGIKDGRTRKAPDNPKLEAAYRKSVQPNQIAELAKQTDLSERQIERWFRRRRNQDKPSTLTKFCENAWKVIFYVANFIFGFYVLWDKSWLWDIDQCYVGYPHHGVTSDVWWYYTISSAFYWSLMISQFWDVRRKDFWQMFVHHVATIALLSFSWVCNLHRIGTLVLLLHDCADIFVESVKAAKYAKYQKLCDALFLMLIVTWIGTRIGVYPFYIIKSTSIRAPQLLPMFPAYYIFNTLLCLLLALHVVWTWLILLIAYNTIKAGQMEGDIRSSNSDLSSSPHDSGRVTPNHVNHNNHKVQQDKSVPKRSSPEGIARSSFAAARSIPFQTPNNNFLLPVSDHKRQSQLTTPNTASKTYGMYQKTVIDRAVDTKPYRNTTRRKHLTRAEMGQVTPPSLIIPVYSRTCHMLNAYIEFKAVTKASQKVCEDICKTIMQTYLDYRRYKYAYKERLLKTRLREDEAAIYDNDTSTVIHGQISGSYMAAYSDTCGFIELDEARSAEKAPVFRTAPGDPVVVIAKCTKIMLNEKILEMAVTLENSDDRIPWTYSLAGTNISWVNGVPGCGKTTWLLSQCDMKTDIIVTTTTEAAKELREKLYLLIGEWGKKRVRTLASLLVNGTMGESCTRLLVDEALMNHFGSIVMAIRISKVSHVILLGDHNQLPFIDRLNLFPLYYNRPDKITAITKELLCTYRCPRDVAYALSEIYNGIHSANTRTRSLTLKRYSGEKIPKSERTLYLLHTQAEKEYLKSQGYGKDVGSCTLTIHEAQGQTFEHVIIARTISKKSFLLESLPHAIVAITRHTSTCVYYTDDASDDTTARLILKAQKATEAEIMDYNQRMTTKWGEHKLES